ncbi:MAG: glycosyltransferase [Blastocatellia bacterium]|nr:glycosyltransferase [Blastocatellia bacterium]
METQRPVLSTCPICESRRLYYAFSYQEYRLVRCADCALLLFNPQPSDAELAAIYTEAYMLSEDTEAARLQVAEMKAATARRYLDLLGHYQGGHGGRLLEVGCGRGDFLKEAAAVGYDVFGVEISEAASTHARARLGRPEAIFQGQIEDVTLPDGYFDVCVLADVIEHTRNPAAFLMHVRRLLKPNGVVFVATPSLDSWSARMLQQNWMEIKTEHLTYFDRNNIQHLLHRTGFREMLHQPGWKVLTFDYVAHHFERFPVPLFSRLIRIGQRILPAKLQKRQIPVVASGMVVLARSMPLPVRQKVSVIVAAYNEAATIEQVLNLLLKKKIPDLDMEIVVVESNSTDGTREIVQRFEQYPQVQVILEDKPSGKGHAVRTGLRHATGDFILIQDADLEYDLEDYDVLLEPLKMHREAFVLGSRHGGTAWKMRQFTGQPILSMALNFGHWFFTTLVNICFGLSLRDPFTMYKVFRRDCLHGLRFHCNRFDFDYELLVKLVRKGYRPIEIPVNYHSRSFKEGKKVSMWRDPFNWLWAIARLRTETIDQLAEIERQQKLLAGDNQPAAKE